MAIPGGSAWLAGAGEDEEFVVEVPETAYYCLAVWKVGRSHLPLAGQYSLEINANLVAVGDPDDVPARTRLASIRPNPFNPSTTVIFELATAGHVRVAIHDLTGARVRTLVDEDRPVGRHEAVWDGRDDYGRTLASGTYIARLTTTGGIRETRKLVMLK
jgi:hypothetical protein